MNFYSLFLSLKQWLRQWGIPFLSGFSTFGLLLIAQPPNDCPEAAFIFLLPALIWFSFKPSLKKIVWVFFVSGFAYHIFLIGWMRHITLEGMILASMLLSVYYLPWFMLARQWVSYALNQSFSKRLLYLICLPAAWVAMEWIRCQFTLGFPWCPLSVTQWERPMILQVLPWTGAWGLSFFLVCFNLCIGSYLHHLLVRRRLSVGGFLSSFCPDFYFGIGLFCLTVAPFFIDKKIFSLEDEQKVRVGICQPYLQDKWVKENARMHKETLQRQTRLLAGMEPDLIVWPEASTPYALNLDSQWVEELVNECNIPLFLGAVIREGNYSYNTASKMMPQTGLDRQWYAKRTLVPFGEYVPLPFRWLPGLSRLVGPVGNFTKGDFFVPLDFPLSKGRNLTFGPLICYEDIFPNLARDAVRKGSEILFVTTNDAWFGEEGCAEQHAAHSVMRAVEAGLPLLRCGNAGWSGWIDPLGRKREVLEDQDGSIYFEGAGIVEVSTKFNRKTLHSKLGDYFAYICFFIFLLLICLCIFDRKRRPEKVGR